MSAVAENLQPGGDEVGGGFEVVEEEGELLLGGGLGDGVASRSPGLGSGGEVLVEGGVDVFGGAAVGGDEQDGEEGMIGRLSSGARIRRGRCRGWGGRG